MIVSGLSNLKLGRGVVFARIRFPGSWTRFEVEEPNFVSLFLKLLTGDFVWGDILLLKDFVTLFEVTTTSLSKEERLLFRDCLFKRDTFSHPSPAVRKCAELNLRIVADETSNKKTRSKCI